MNMKTKTVLTILITTMLSGVVNAGLKIYYIRHAEGGHNVKKAWQKKGTPEAEWPEYVGNPDMFTPKGLKEVVGATEKLQKYQFDFIASSPLWRCRNTILPYMKLTKQKGEIWPELKEAPGMITILSKDIPDVKEDIFNKGKAIEISENEKDVFSLRPDGKNDYARVPKGSTEQQKVAYTKHAALHIIKMIEQRFGGSDQSILLAGHNSSGVSLMKLLLKEEPTGKALRGISNATIWMVEQQDDGSYELKMYNDEPYVAVKAEKSK